MFQWLQTLCTGAAHSPANVIDYLGITAQDLSRHFFLCGETGSGKTSVLRILLEAVLNRYRPGGLHCCVKADEAEWICELIESTSMRDRLLHLQLGKFHFNVAGFEMGRIGGSPESLTRLLQRLNDLRNRTSGDGSEKNFWKNLFFDYMHFAAIIVWQAYGRESTLEHIYQVISTSPASIEAAKAKTFLDSACWKILKQAEANVSTAPDIRSFTRAAEFYLKIQNCLGEKARAAGVQECSSVLSPFLLSPFYETFCNAKSDFTPKLPLRQVYTVLDFPVLVYGPQAQLAQALISMMTIEAALRQVHPKHFTLIVRDEIQLLAGEPQFKRLAHSVARSHGLSFWSAVQNLPLLSSSFGGDAKAETQMKSLIANYGTKFVLANSCMDITNRFFSTMFGQHKEQFYNFNEQSQQVSQDNCGLMESVFGKSAFNFGASTSYADRVPPDHFLHLRRGGPPHFLVDAYIAGRIFPETGLPYRLVTFSQR